MGDTNGRKIAHIFKKLTWHRVKSNRKYENAVEWYILILRKEEKEGQTKWVLRTKEKAEARLKKYSIPMSRVKELLDQRGYKDLSSKIA